MTEPGDVTVGELFRAVGKIEKSVDDGFRHLNERIDAMSEKFVSKELYESEKQSLHEKIDGAAGRRQWLVTTLIAVAAGAADCLYFLTHMHS